MSKNNIPSQEELIKAASKAASTKEQKRANSKGTLIYQPQGPAGEYAKWAVNLYNGCSNGCTYCYNRRGMLSHVFGDEPKLAAPIIKERDRRIKSYIDQKLIAAGSQQAEDLKTIEIKKAAVYLLMDDISKIGEQRLKDDGGIFFSFTCDPLSEETSFLTLYCARQIIALGIPVTILTKNTEFLDDELSQIYWQTTRDMGRNLLTIGFTITGMDELEPRAASTDDRITALQQVRAIGYKSFVSMEPIIDIQEARNILMYIIGETDEIRIGLQSPFKKDRYDYGELMDFLRYLVAISRNEDEHHTRIALKQSFFDERLYKQIPAHLHDDYMELVNELKCNEPIR